MLQQQYLLGGHHSRHSSCRHTPAPTARCSSAQLGSCSSAAVQPSISSLLGAACCGDVSAACLLPRHSSGWSPAAVVCNASRNRHSSSTNSNSTNIRQDQLIAPLDPSGPLIPLDTSSSSSSAAAAAAAARARARANLRHDSRRGALVKIRVAPRRYRLRQSFDQPRRIRASPEDPSFQGRLTSEINSCYGPRQLTKLLQDFGPHLTAAHCASAISLLAGMATGQQLQRDGLQQAYQAPAARAAELLTACIAQASLLDCARATYGLARLQLHIPALLGAAAAHSRGQLATATPQALAGLAVGLAHWGYTPEEAWQQELCIEAFAQMSGFGAQDLANLLFALAVWRRPISQTLLQRCLTAFRGHWGSPGCTAPTLVRFIFALTQLPPCQPLPPGMQQALPDGAPVYQHHQEWRQQQEARELDQVMRWGAGTAGEAGGGAAQQQQGQQQWQRQGPAGSEAGIWLDQGDSISSREAGRSSSSSSSSSWGRRASVRQQPAATYRLPSFNWLTAFLAEAQRQIDRMRPAELSSLLWCMACLNHTPNLIFMDCWYRAAAARMHAFNAQSLALCLQALGMLRPGRDVPGGVSGRWLQAALGHSQGLLGSCGAQELSQLLWGFGELRFWPGQAWMDDWLTVTQQQLPSMQPSDLTDTVWALARLRYTPPMPWTQTIAAAISTALPGFSAQGLAMVIWGFSRLGLRPERQWLLRFKASTGAQYEDESARRLAQFLAGLLAQHNRQRFSAQQGRLPRMAAQ